MDYLTYKFIHLVGAFFLFTALAGLVVAAKHGDAQFRKLGSIVHGLSLVALLVSGFGLMARLSIEGIPGWIWAKLVIWLAFGAVVVLIKRWADGRLVLWLVIPLLGAVAAYLGVHHGLYQPPV